jgi:ribosomal protein S18 acetylase RimI-like enzyme
MKVLPLAAVELDVIAAVMRTGRPWLPDGTDCWLWRECFGDTSFVAQEGAAAAGGLLACMHQRRRDELYIDQVAVDPAWRGRGITKLLFDAAEEAARRRGCRRVWLSTDPANPAVRAWPALGFQSVGIQKDFKGPGKDRAIFEKRLA